MTTNAQTEKSWTLALRAIGSDKLEVSIYDVIGSGLFSDGITAKDVLAKLRAAPNASTISLRINSIGGIVDEAKAMVNLLNERAANGVKVEAFVDGLAASSASYLLTAASRVVMPENSFMMLHGVRGGARGDAKDLEEAAALYRRTNDQLAAAYSAASQRRGKNKSKDDYLASFASGDLYLDADEAIDWGLADEKLEALKMAACLVDVDQLTDAPEALRSAPYVVRATRQEPQPPPNDGPAKTEETPIREIKTMAENTPAPTNINTITMMRALDLPVGATEQDGIGACVRLRQLEVQVQALTAAPTTAEALGQLRAMKADADRCKSAEAELVKIKAERDAQNFDVLVAQGRTDRKLSPAEEQYERELFTRACADGRGAEQVENLRGLLKIKSPTIPSRDIKQPEARSLGSLTWNGKAYKDISFSKRAELKKEDPELFRAMKQDFEATAT